MFDKYVIVDESLRNVVDTHQVPGFAFDVRIAYYRGLALSMVEPFTISVDGVTYPDSAVTFTVHGNTYTAAQMADEVEDRWEMVEAATLTVAHPGGLSEGLHEIAVVEHLRISYVPNIVEAPCAKTLPLTAAA